jgi:ribose 5-phosphate isomerase B
MSTIYLGTDHAGFALKEAVKQHLSEQGYEIVDVGAATENPGDDYPDFIFPAVEGAMHSGSRAIVFGGSGIGECIAANKVVGARAALVYDDYTAQKSREHNDANVLCLGGRTVTKDFMLAKQLVDIWLGTVFSGDSRHIARLDKISAYEK